MNFSEALIAIKAGCKLARTSWNTEGLAFVYLVHGSKFKVNRAPLNVIFKMDTEVTYRPHLDCKMPDGTCGTWTADDNDLLAEDWEIIE
jgi:hypothetical protein